MRLNLSTFLFLSALLGGAAAWADDTSDINQLLRAGKLGEAQARIDKAMSERPKDVQLRFLKGVVQREAGRTYEAIATFTKITEDHPELPEPYNNLAVIYASQNQWDKARSALEMALRTNPSYATAHENLADVYAKLASQAYSKALQMDDKAAAAPAKLALIGEVHAPGTVNASSTKAIAQAAKPGAAPSAATPAPVVVAAQAAPAPISAAPAAPAAPVSAAKPTETPAPTPAAKASTPTAAASATAATSPAHVPATPSVAKTSPEPAAASASLADNKLNPKDVEAAVAAWARAWASKNMSAYLSAYGADFKPASGQTRSAWEQERRLKITSKNAISLKLNNLSVTVTADRAVAKFQQEYKADALAVTSRKTLELTKVSGRWLISKEATGS